MGQSQSSEEVNKNGVVVNKNGAAVNKCTSAKMNWGTISTICDKNHHQQETDNQCKLEVDPSLLNSLCKLNFNSGETYHLNFSDGKPKPCNI